MAQKLLNKVMIEDAEAFERWWERFNNYIKQNPDTFKELKSQALYKEQFGGILMGEEHVMEFMFDSVADLEKFSRRVAQDEGYKKLEQELAAVAAPAPGSQMILSDKR